MSILPVVCVASFAQTSTDTLTAVERQWGSEAISRSIREGLLGETTYGLYPYKTRELARGRFGLAMLLHKAASKQQSRSEAFLKGSTDDRERATLLRLSSMTSAYDWANAEFHRQYPDIGKDSDIDTGRLLRFGRAIDATSASRHRLFADIPVDHWAAKAVGDLRALGLLDGYPDGKYRG